MADPLEGLGNLPIGPSPLRPAGPGGVGKPGGTDAAGKSFTDYLKDSIDEVNRLQTEADSAINKLATGETQNLTEVMNAVQKADLAFQLFNQIRGKLIAAYTELKNMRM
jgi:flagellar hook-basal body complex protein FliE